MQTNSERFSQGTQRELIGIYIPIHGGYGFERIIPSKEPLTVDNFGIVMDGNTYTAHDFRWYDGGSNRNFKFDDSDNYIESSCVPDEVFLLLNTVICTKFAMQYLDDAKAMLDYIKDDEIREKVKKGIADFAKATGKKKLQIARTVLIDVFNNIDIDVSNEFCIDVFDNIDIDISNEFGYATFIIEKVLLELADRCQ